MLVTNVYDTSCNFKSMHFTIEKQIKNILLNNKYICRTNYIMAHYYDYRNIIDTTFFV